MLHSNPLQLKIRHFYSIFIKTYLDLIPHSKLNYSMKIAFSGKFRDYTMTWGRFRPKGTPYGPKAPTDCLVLWYFWSKTSTAHTKGFLTLFYLGDFFGILPRVNIFPVHEIHPKLVDHQILRVISCKHIPTSNYSYWDISKLKVCLWYFHFH